MRRRAPPGSSRTASSQAVPGRRAKPRPTETASVLPIWPASMTLAGPFSATSEKPLVLSAAAHRRQRLGQVAGRARRWSFGGRWRGRSAGTARAGGFRRRPASRPSSRPSTAGRRRHSPMPPGSRRWRSRTSPSADGRADAPRHRQLSLRIHSGWSRRTSARSSAGCRAAVAGREAVLQHARLPHAHAGIDRVQLVGQVAPGGRRHHVGVGAREAFGAVLAGRAGEARSGAAWAGARCGCSPPVARSSRRCHRRRAPARLSLPPQPARPAAARRPPPSASAACLAARGRRADHATVRRRDHRHRLDHQLAAAERAEAAAGRMVAELEADVRSQHAAVGREHAAVVAHPAELQLRRRPSAARRRSGRCRWRRPSRRPGRRG